MVNPLDMDELLGAYALDAVNDEERRAVEDYLLANPRARMEVQEHREVATMLAWSGMTAPDGLWDRIASNLEGRETAPESELGQVLAMRPSRRQKSWGRTIGSWAAATAAAATIAIVAVRVSSSDTTKSANDRLERILADPSSLKASLVSPSTGNLKIFAAIDPQGHGVLLGDSLPSLDPSRTYQLWGQLVGGAELISLGVLGSNPKTEEFTVNGEVKLLAITAEVGGGVVTSSNPVVVAGTPV
jgi:hypothetical protein